MKKLLGMIAVLFTFAAIVSVPIMVAEQSGDLMGWIVAGIMVTGFYYWSEVL